METRALIEPGTDSGPSIGRQAQGLQPLGFEHDPFPTQKGRGGSTCKTHARPDTTDGRRLMRIRWTTVVLLGLVTAAVGAEPQGAKPAGAVYFEAEECFSLRPIGDKIAGFFGTGYREVGASGAPEAIDKTVFLFGNPVDREEYTVWLRAYVEPSVDRRVAVEWIGEQTEQCDVRFEPTRAKADRAGFRWERAGVVKGLRRHFYQLRLHAVEGSRPIIDAVLLSVDPDRHPKETVRPCDDREFTGGDGEGSTRINRSTLVVGSDTELEVVYTAGESGIAEGGALRFFIPESWSPPQSTDASEPGHVTAVASREGVELRVDCHQPGKGAYAFSHELRHHHESFVRVGSGSLEAGDTITVRYAGQVQPYTQSRDDFRNEVRAWYSPALPLGMSTDANADGVFWTVAPERSHAVGVVAAEPARFSVVVPSVLRTGEPLVVKVAALDAFRNPAATYTGDLTFSLVSLTDGQVVDDLDPLTASITPADGGWARCEAARGIGKPGAYAVRVADAKHDLEGLSNPIKCTAEEPPYRVFWGDLHTHHRRCDGLRRFEEAAAHARDVAGLDVVALSPHACYITDGDLADLWRVDEQFHESGRFVPLFAYEWAAGGQGAAHSVIYSEKPMPLCFRAFGGGNVVKGRAALHEQLDKHGLDVVEVPHHVRGVTERDPRYQKAIEIYSQWGSHEPGVVANFNDGLRACVFGTSDNHTGQPGLQPISNRWAIHHHYCGLTAFLMPRLARVDLFAAIEARRCYATADCRVLAELHVNGHAMGEQFTMTSPAEPRVVELEAIASTPIATIALVRSGQPIQTWHPDECEVRLRYEDAAGYGGPTDYYYLRIECDETQKAWLTPVWVTFENPVPSPAALRPEARHNDQPGPAPARDDQFPGDDHLRQARRADRRQARRPFWPRGGRARVGAGRPGQAGADRVRPAVELLPRRAHVSRQPRRGFADGRVRWRGDGRLRQPPRGGIRRNARRTRVRLRADPGTLRAKLAGKQHRERRGPVDRARGLRPVAGRPPEIGATVLPAGIAAAPRPAEVRCAGVWLGLRPVGALMPALRETVTQAGGKVSPMRRGVSLVSTA